MPFFDLILSNHVGFNATLLINCGTSSIMSENKSNLRFKYYFHFIA